MKGGNWHFWENKTRFLIFSDLWLALDPTGAKISKRYSSLKSPLNLFKLFLNFLLRGPHKSTVLDYWNLSLQFFTIFFCFRSHGSKNLKTLLFPQITFDFFFQTSAEFSSPWSSQKYCLEFFFFFLKFCVYDFFPKISNSPLYPMEKPKTSIIWKMSVRGAKQSEILDWWVLVVQV